MPFSVSGLATGLGGVEEGFQQQQADELRRQQLLFAQAATVAAGRGFQGLVPGASPLLPGAGGPGPAPPSQPGAGSGIPGAYNLPPSPAPPGQPIPKMGDLSPPGGGMGDRPMPPQGFTPGPVGPYAVVTQPVPSDPTSISPAMRAPVPGLPPRQQPAGPGALPGRLMIPAPYGGTPGGFAPT